jgi:hypothetical protein
MLMLVGRQERRFVGIAGVRIVGSLFMSGAALAVRIATSMECRCGKRTVDEVLSAD